MLICDDANFENVQISWIAWKYAWVVLLEIVPRLMYNNRALSREKGLGYKQQRHMFFVPVHFFSRVGFTLRL